MSATLIKERDDLVTMTCQFPPQSSCTNYPEMSGLALGWRDICVWGKRRNTGSFWCRPKYEQQQLLYNVCGIAKSGSLLAIMGGSGAGKTTLLAAISRRLKGDVLGDILVNGWPVDAEFMSHVSGFVPQQDLAIDSLTVQEHMVFMASLKMDSRTGSTLRCQRISSLLSELGLTKCKKTRLSALSGGEMKRLSLAVQLLTDPLLLFCDEPTTGLDSFSASQVTEKLRQLSLQGKAVICTIHQPASGVFDLFSHILLLAGGRVAFYGEVAEAAKYFMSLNLICPKAFNCAEFYISQLAVTTDEEDECHRKIKWICDEFHSSHYSHNLFEQLTSLMERQQHFLSSQEVINGQWSSSHSDCSSIDQESEFHKYMTVQKPRTMTQLYWLVWRALTDITRKSSENLLRCGVYMLIALMLATPYMNLTVDQRGIQNLQGLMYLIITENVFTFTYSVFHTFPGEMPILLREIADGVYKPGPFYLSKMLVLLPRPIVESLLYTFLIFWIAGLQGGVTDFLLFCIPVTMSAMTATAYGCVLSAAFDSVATASLMSVPIEFISLTFSGLFLNLGNLPPYLSWVRYISQFYYGIEAVSILQWGQITHIRCTDGPQLPCLDSGTAVLRQYGYSNNNYPVDLLGLLTIYALSHGIGFFAIWIRTRQQPIY